MKWINFEPLSDSGDKIILGSALIAMSVGGCVKPLDIRGTVPIFPVVFKSGECFPICKGCDFCLPQLITFPIKSPPIPLFRIPSWLVRGSEILTRCISNNVYSVGGCVKSLDIEV